MERNRLLTHLALLRPRSILLLAPAALFMELAVLAGAFRGGWFRKKLASYAALFRPSTLRWLVRKRGEINGLRLVSDRSAMEHFVPRIDHQEVNNPILNLFLNPMLNLYWNLVKRLL